MARGLRAVDDHGRAAIVSEPRDLGERHAAAGGV
jgi:hypothetical protein